MTVAVATQLKSPPRGAAWSGVDVTVWDSLIGWTAGAGWEYALGYGWSWKSEFLYIDYGWSRFFDPAEACSPSCDAFLNPREVNLKNYVFRTGLNWRFGRLPSWPSTDRSIEETPPFISRAT
jgi:opacity protein-like surface antigen